MCMSLVHFYTFLVSAFEPINFPPNTASPVLCQRRRVVFSLPSAESFYFLSGRSSAQAPLRCVRLARRTRELGFRPRRSAASGPWAQALRSTDRCGVRRGLVGGEKLGSGPLSRAHVRAGVGRPSRAGCVQASHAASCFMLDF